MVLGQDISNIHEGPDTLSTYLLSRLQTQNVQHRANSLPMREYLDGDDMVDTFKEWVVVVTGAFQR
jgi:hypothetical protein